MQFKTVTFALQGTSHVKSNKPCQDKVLVKEANDVHFFGLADGAGSAKKSGLGAKEILKRISYFVVECFDKLYESSPGEVAANEATVIKETLKSLSEHNRREQKDFSSTLLWIATKGNKVILSHLGDGTISLHTSKGWVIQSQPENGEFANQTYLTTYSNLAPHIRVQKGTAKTLGDVDGILLASDGGTSGFAGSKLGEKQLSYSSDVVDKIYSMLQEQSEEACSEEIQNFYKDFVMKEITEDDCSIVLSIVDRPRKPTINATELICKRIYGEITEENLYKSGKIKEAYKILGEVGEPVELIREIEELLSNKSIMEDHNDDTEELLSEEYGIKEPLPEDNNADYYDKDPWNILITGKDSTNPIEEDREDSIEEDEDGENSANSIEEDLGIEIQFEDTVGSDEAPEEVEASKGEKEATPKEVEVLDYEEDKETPEEDETLDVLKDKETSKEDEAPNVLKDEKTPKEIDNTDDFDYEKDENEEVDEDSKGEELVEYEDSKRVEPKEIDDLDYEEESETVKEVNDFESEPKEIRESSPEPKEIDDFDCEEDEETFNTVDTKEDEAPESVKHSKEVSSKPHESEEKTGEFVNEAEYEFVPDAENEFVPDAEDEFVPDEDSKGKEGFGEKL